MFEVSKAEVEISELDKEDRLEFMKELNIKEPGIDLLCQGYLPQAKFNFFFNCRRR